MMPIKLVIAEDNAGNLVVRENHVEFKLAKCNFKNTAKPETLEAKRMFIYCVIYNYKLRSA